MSQNNQFHQVCETWVRVALAYLQRLSVLPYYGDIEVTFTPDGLYSTHPGTPKIAAEHLVSDYREELFNSPEYNAVVDTVISTPALSSVLCPDVAGQPPLDLSRQKQMLEAYFSTFLVEYIKTKQDVSFAQRIFEDIYQKFEEYIYSTEPILTKELIHIRNLRSEIDNVSIGNQVFLRRATYEEKKEVLRMPRDILSFAIVPETILEIHNHVSARAYLPVDKQMEVHKIAQAVVFALRLIKPDFVELDMQYHDISDQPFRHRGGIGRSILQNPHQGHAPYILTTEDVDILTQLWPKAKKAYNKPELLMARTRLEGSYLRSTLEDMLIDYWIGLEALFLPPDYTREMAEAVALAVSNYLGRTVGSRNSIYHELINSHKLRGKVVHGNKSMQKTLKR
jgi:Apea-like HEPN